MNSTNGSVRIGPISLFTLVIILCLAVMAVLSATTAQATYSAAEKQALFTNDTYQNEQAAQSAVAVIDAALKTCEPPEAVWTKRLPPWTRRCRPTRSATGRECS